MNRQIVYIGAIPQDVDQLSQNKNTMIGLGFALQAILGTTTQVDGLACTPNSPAALNVLVASGSIYSLQNIDGTAYGSLAADTTNQIVKQGISQSTLTLSCPAPGTPGQSVVYLIQAAYQDVDGGSTVLPYYNASNPASAWSGPNNTGVSQNTVRQGVCTVNAKTGVAATTGSQTTPAPDAGFIGLYAVTVANGQTTITSGNIQQLTTAPFITPKIPAINTAIQTGAATFAVDSSVTPNTITVAFTPKITALTNGMKLRVKVANATTGATVMNVDTLGNVAVVTTSLAALSTNSLLANGIYDFTYDANGTRWQAQAVSAAAGLLAANNLSDVANATTSLTNLGTARPVQSSFKNLSAAWASNSTFTITADEVIVEDGSANVSKASTVSLTVNTATTGANGCDVALSGFSASSWAYGYVIQKPDGTTAALLSASATSPTMPSGYTFKALVTAVRLDGSKNIVGFKQYGRDWQYVVGSNLSTALNIVSGSAGNASTPTWVAQSVTGIVPTAIAAKIKLVLTDASGSALGIAAPNNSYGGGASLTNPPPMMVSSSSVCTVMGEFILESTNVYYAGGATNALFCMGFTINI